MNPNKTFPPTTTPQDASESRTSPWPTHMAASVRRCSSGGGASSWTRLGEQPEEPRSSTETWAPDCVRERGGRWGVFEALHAPTSPTVHLLPPRVSAVICHVASTGNARPGTPRSEIEERERNPIQLRQCMNLGERFILSDNIFKLLLSVSRAAFGGILL